MRVSEAVTRYLAWKRSQGFRYDSLERDFASFSQYMGNKNVLEITPHQIAAYLNGAQSSNSTWHHKYGHLRQFIDYLKHRGELKKSPMPPAIARHDKAFIPYIYSRSEISRLVDHRFVGWCVKANAKRIAPETLRALLLFLYGTGVSVGEALTLQMKHLDLKRNVVTLERPDEGRIRTIPIGRDVHKLLERYLALPVRREIQAAYVFVNVKGAPINPVTLGFNFQRLRRRAGITRPGRPRNQPRMHDFRFTFAVHRIASWYRDGIDVPKKLPALAAYMGHTGLRAVERYLALTPEHYREQLRHMSSGRPPQKIKVKVLPETS